MNSREWAIYAITVGASLTAHVTFLRSMNAAVSQTPVRRRPIEMAMIRPAPKPPPPPPVALKPSEPPKFKPVPKLAPKVPVVKDVPPPPPNAPPPKNDAPPQRPTFGIHMASVVGPGQSSFAVPVGNTLMQADDGKHVAVRDVHAYRAVAAHEVTRMPKKVGDCTAVYPGEARQLGVEGRVTLDVEVLPDGKVGEVTVIAGLGHGLDEAAVAALKACKFTPAQLDGENVGTRIQYVYTFLIED